MTTVFTPAYITVPVHLSTFPKMFYTDHNISCISYLFSSDRAHLEHKVSCLAHALMMPINTLRPRQNGRHFPDDIFKRIFLNENVWIWLKISLKFVPKGPINNIPALVQIMAWRRPGDKPLSEPMMVNLSTHICVSRPQLVNTCFMGVWISCCSLITS